MQKADGGNISLRTTGGAFSHQRLHVQNVRCLHRLRFEIQRFLSFRSHRFQNEGSDILAWRREDRKAPVVVDNGAAVTTPLLVGRRLKKGESAWVALLSHLPKYDGATVSRYTVVSMTLGKAAVEAVRQARLDKIKAPVVEQMTRIWL